MSKSSDHRKSADDQDIKVKESNASRNSQSLYGKVETLLEDYR